MRNLSGEARPLVKLLVVTAALIAVVPAVHAQLVVNEIMNNPSAVVDGSGEWFEIFNPTGGAVDING